MAWRVLLAAVVFFGCCGLAESVGGGRAGVYLVQNVAYSFYLKNVVIVDVMVLALGFLLRVLAGVVVVQVTTSARGSMSA